MKGEYVVNEQLLEEEFSMVNAIAERIDIIQKLSEISGREIAQLLNATPETVSRWRGGKTEPQARMRDRLLQLEWLAQELAGVYQPKEAHLWLFSRHKLLGGDRPVDLIQRGESEKVLEIIAQLKDGAYV